jgi:hypothetical protein
LLPCRIHSKVERVLGNRRRRPPGWEIVAGFEKALLSPAIVA